MSDESHFTGVIKRFEGEAREAQFKCENIKAIANMIDEMLKHGENFTFEPPAPMPPTNEDNRKILVSVRFAGLGGWTISLGDERIELDEAGGHKHHLKLSVASEKEEKVFFFVRYERFSRVLRVIEWECRMYDWAERVDDPVLAKLFDKTINVSNIELAAHLFSGLLEEALDHETPRVETQGRTYALELLRMM